MDMTKVTHEEAIQVLKTSSDPLSFLVRHDSAPAGLREITLVTKPREGFGFVLAGGMTSCSGNPFDDTDEGIFISQVLLVLSGGIDDCNRVRSYRVEQQNKTVD